MRCSDMIPASQEGWLKKLVESEEFHEILELYLVYDNTKMPLDEARDKWCEIVGEDFVAENSSDIISNESISAGRQQGIHYSAPPVSEGQYHWWLKLSTLDKDLWEVIPL